MEGASSPSISSPPSFAHRGRGNLDFLLQPSLVEPAGEKRVLKNRTPFGSAAVLAWSLPSRSSPRHGRFRRRRAHLVSIPEMPYQAEAQSRHLGRLLCRGDAPLPCERAQGLAAQIPQSDFGQEVSDSELSTFPVKVEPRIGVEKVHGNKFAYFEFNHPEGTAQDQFAINSPSRRGNSVGILIQPKW